jgi:hypothetical protein
VLTSALVAFVVSTCNSRRWEGRKMVPATPISVAMAGSLEPGLAAAADAAAKLANDVNAAAEALENVKRMLQRQRADQVRARLQSGHEPEAARSFASMLPQSTRMISAVPHRGMALLSPRDLLLADPEPRRLDIRGFLVGFALSAAIGAALYLCLVAG